MCEAGAQAGRAPAALPRLPLDAPLRADRGGIGRGQAAGGRSGQNGAEARHVGTLWVVLSYQVKVPNIARQRATWPVGSDGDLTLARSR